MAVAALVIGIISVVVAIFGGVFSWLGTVFGIVGIILAIQGRKNIEQQGMATAGLVLSIIGTILGLLLFLACAACVGGLGILDSI